MPQTQHHPDLGLSVTLFEPYSNLAPEIRAAVSNTTPEPRWHDARRGLRLYQGDALELLHRAKAETFDFIFADPPYFLSSGSIIYNRSGNSPRPRDGDKIFDQAKNITFFS